MRLLEKAIRQTAACSSRTFPIFSASPRRGDDMPVL